MDPIFRRNAMIVIQLAKANDEVVKNLSQTDLKTIKVILETLKNLPDTQETKIDHNMFLSLERNLIGGSQSRNEGLIRKLFLRFTGDYVDPKTIVEGLEEVQDYDWETEKNVFSDLLTLGNFEDAFTKLENSTENPALHADQIKWCSDWIESELEDSYRYAGTFLKRFGKDLSAFAYNCLLKDTLRWCSLNKQGQKVLFELLDLIPDRVDDKDYPLDKTLSSLTRIYTFNKQYDIVFALLERYPEHSTLICEQSFDSFARNFSSEQDLLAIIERIPDKFSTTMHALYVRLLELKSPPVPLEKIRETIESNLGRQFLLDYDAVCNANFDSFEVGVNLYNSLNSPGLKNLLVERLLEKFPNITSEITLKEVEDLMAVFNQLDDGSIRDSFCKKFTRLLLAVIPSEIRLDHRERACELTLRLLALAPDMKDFAHFELVNMGDELSRIVRNGGWDASELNQRFDELPESEVKDAVRKCYEDDFEIRR